MQYFDFTVAPNKVAPISCQGQRFYYSAGVASGLDVTIKVRFGTSGQSVILKPGQGVRAPAGTAISDTAYIENYKGEATIIGTVFIGDDDIIDNRMSGVVEVVNGGKARVLAGNSFSGSIGCVAAAGIYALTQIWNPAASGKNVFVNRIIIGGSAVGEWIVSSTNIQLLSLGGGFESRKLGSAASAAERRYEGRAALGGTIFDVNLSLNVPFDVVTDEPWMIPPGRGLCVYPLTFNVPAVANFSFYEELV